MSKTLLLADDSVVIQKLVGLSFANEDVEIVATDNGDDAIERAREVAPDIILADVVMPGMSGYEVCEAVKQDPTLCHIPVLLLTGTFEAFDENRARAAGANGQITKPFEAQALVARVNEVLNTPVEAPPAPVSPESPSTPEEPTPGFGLFDSQVASLSPSETSQGLTEQTPSIDGMPPMAMNDLSDTTASDLFGEPGEGAGDELLPLADSMPISGPMAEASKEAPPLEEQEDATIAILPDAHPTTFDALDSAASRASDDSDPLSGFDDGLALDDRLAMPDPTSVSPVDLDRALDGASAAVDATILVATNDGNAATSPNYASVDEPQTAQEAPPLPSPLPPPVPTAVTDDLMVHFPTSGIDSDSATASPPAPNGSYEAPVASHGGPGMIDEPPVTVVTDLDADLHASIEPDLETSPEEPLVEVDPTPLVNTPPADSPTSDRTQEGQEMASGVGFGAQAPAAPQPLDLGPMNVGVDDLDFSFDVSEQISAESVSDSLGKSFSDFSDLVGSPSPADPIASAETVVADYDVSSSDLATAPPPPAAPDASAPEFDATVVAGLEPIAARDDVPASTDEAFAIDTDRSLAGSIEEPIADSATNVADEIFAGFAASSLGAALDDEVPTAMNAADDDEFAIGESTSTGFAPPMLDSEGSETDRISDLSPLMEQRIQETLEKVAWEAFSDLSEAIVKQVLERVEKIAWEVIPQMAETLVREEIRQMKGEDD